MLLKNAFLYRDKFYSVLLHFTPLLVSFPQFIFVQHASGQKTDGTSGIQDNLGTCIGVGIFTLGLRITLKIFRLNCLHCYYIAIYEKKKLLPTYKKIIHFHFQLSTILSVLPSKDYVSEWKCPFKKLKFLTPLTKSNLSTFLFSWLE